MGRKKKIQYIKCGKYPGNIEIGEFYDGEKRVGLVITICDDITEHTRSQIHRAWVTHKETEE